MTFHFSSRTTNPRQRWLQRMFEILPGALSWGILIGMVVLAWWQPIPAALLIIAFDLYWLFRLFYLTLFLLLSYLRLKAERQTDWQRRLTDVDQAEAGSVVVAGQGGQRGLSAWLYRRQLATLQRCATPPPPSTAIHHLVIIPIAKETREVIEPGLAALAGTAYPRERLIMVLALEGRADESVANDIRALQERYRHRFEEVLLTVHPDGIPGEARVKGANITYAARAAAEYLQAKGIAFERVIVSCFDADTVVGPEYLACLTYHFLTCSRRTRASFQPVPVYHNNIWQAPFFASVLDVGASFFQLIEATNPENLVTFSSHSMSFQALVDIGYWPVDMISDDSAIFWKALLHYDGDYRVVPMYVTVSMDVAAGTSWWATLRNVYRQKRRWAWGVENAPIVMRGFLAAKQIPLGVRLRHTFKLLEGHISWATWPFLLGIVGWLPAVFAGREFSDTVLYFSAPRIAGLIFNLASLSLVVSITLSLLLLPEGPGGYRGWLRRLGFAFAWLFIPLIVTVLSALPALDAQTRLMWGRRLEFWVTDKRRTAKAAPAARREAVVRT